MFPPALRDRCGAAVGPAARNRVKLTVFGVLTVVAALAGAPGWTVLALAATTVVIPVAVALAGEAAVTSTPSGQPAPDRAGGSRGPLRCSAHCRGPLLGKKR